MDDVWQDYFADRISPEPNSGCYLWMGGLSHYGYGTAHHSQIGSIVAHRLSWILANGPIEGGGCVLHRCDVRICVNPTHLFLGTRLDNNKDRDEKNRQARGEKHGSAKLNQTQIRKIRRRADNNEPRKDIAKDFGVSVRTIWSIKTRKTWEHVK